VRPRGLEAEAAVGPSGRGVSLGLTAAQVGQVIAATTDGAENVGLLAGLSRPGELRRSPLMEDRTMSRSLLFGLVVLIAFPADCAYRGVKDPARELELPISTTHRYVHTLHAAGLLEQDPSSRRYRRCHGLG
jgi:hypothetical protein